MTKWHLGLRRIWDNAARELDWDAHIQSLNLRLGLDESAEFRSSFPGLPPIWFQGNVEVLLPREWTLVISLNHQLSGNSKVPSWDGYWDYCRTHVAEPFYARFFRPLVRLASLSMGESVSTTREGEYAVTRMVFTELCPYASRRFSIPPNHLASLLATDRGCVIASEMTDFLLTHGLPALVLVNGLAATEQFENHNRERLAWSKKKYASESRMGKTLWHKQGWLAGRGLRIPVVGFPFLRTPASHNFYKEIDQLAVRVEALVSESRRASS